MFTVNAQIVANVFANLQARIPAYDHETALRFAMRLVEENNKFDTASEAAGYVGCRLWNSGYVK